MTFNVEGEQILLNIPVNTDMPANDAKPANTNTSMPIFLTRCETEMHIWKLWLRVNFFVYEKLLFLETNVQAY